MKPKCPKCGYSITIKGIGRKRLSIPFNNVFEAFQWHDKGYWLGQPHFLNTSIEYYRLFGVNISGGTIKNRLKEEAQYRGLTYQELVKNLADQASVEGKQKYLRAKMSGKL